MNQDYIYCLAHDNCIHRRACKRWIGNYSDEEVKQLCTDSRFINEVDCDDCIPNDYKLLNRFRSSTGEEL